jgi:ubiquinone/menaquinone biosynthesis C-methylase UbiE
VLINDFSLAYLWRALTLKSFINHFLGYSIFKLEENTWELTDIVKEYSTKTFLFEPESAILNMLRTDLPRMRMLDIGVGAGRTTFHFAPLAREYVGIDSSEAMIKTCRQKFPRYSFEVADARNLALFDDGVFDFVLFSFNGIDYVNHEDRLKVLREVHRITRNGGFFYFSAHNLNWVWKLYSLKLQHYPLNLVQEPLRIVFVRLTNRRIWRELRNGSGRYLIFNDGAHMFTLKTYYVSPNEQIKQLFSAGFTNIKIISRSDGKEIHGNSENLRNERWFYWLCNAIH